MTNTTNTAAASGAADNCTILPDGSAFAVGSFPLPQDHWLYAPHEYEPGSYEPKELLAPILTHAQRRGQRACQRHRPRQSAKQKPRSAHLHSGGSKRWSLNE